jgi:hypothetical protein
MTKSAVLYNRLAKVGRGALTAHKKDISSAMRESVQQDVATDALSAMQRYMKSGAYQNLEVMLVFCKGVTWFSENQKATMELHRLKLELQRGKPAVVELKAREWLEKEKTLAARILSAINSN